MVKMATINQTEPTSNFSWWDMDNSTRLPDSTDNGTLASFTVAPTKIDVTQAVWVRAIFIALYSLIFLLGIVGNSLVVYVVIRNKSMQTITNIFITNLALSDIMMCLLAVPFTPLSAFLRSWVFGDALCHLVPMALGVSVYVSTLTSTAIAIDRYFVIVHPFKPRMKIFVCLLLIIAIWIISISISLPLAIYQKVFWLDAQQVYVCYEHWPKTTARQFFTVTNLILQYIVPCSIITFCYTKVSIVLRTRSRSKIGWGSKSREKDELEIKRKKRTNKMLIAMVAIFVCCWLPLNIVHIISEYKGTVQDWKYFVLVFFIAHVIAMSSTIYNPLLYAWMNENFKKEFKLVVPCIFSRSKGRHGMVNGSTNYTHVDTQNTLLTRSPMKERTIANHSANSRAMFDADSEKVHLRVTDTEDE